MSHQNNYVVVVGETGRLIECSKELYEFLRDNVKSTAAEYEETHIVELQ
jgi:hypothetical protein